MAVEVAWVRMCVIRSGVLESAHRSSQAHKSQWLNLLKFDELVDNYTDGSYHLVRQSARCGALIE